METKQITKKEFINMLNSAEKVGYVWGGSSRNHDFLKIATEYYDDLTDESKVVWRTIAKSNAHKIVWSNGSTLDFDQWGTKKYYQIGRIILQLTTHENEAGYEDFKTAVYYLLPIPKEMVA